MTSNHSCNVTEYYNATGASNYVHVSFMNLFVNCDRASPALIWGPYCSSIYQFKGENVKNTPSLAVDVAYFAEYAFHEKIRVVYDGRTGSYIIQNGLTALHYSVNKIIRNYLAKCVNISINHVYKRGWEHVRNTSDGIIELLQSVKQT